MALQNAFALPPIPRDLNASPPEPQSPVLAAGQGASDLFAFLNQAPEEGGVEIKMEKTSEGPPIWTYTVGDRANSAIMQSLSTAQQVRESYMQEMANLQARENYTRQHGLFNLLSNLAGNFAQAKEMPGWVQALGKTSTDLNPTPDALMRQRMALQPGLMGALQQETMAAGQMVDLSAQQQARVIAENRTIATEQKTARKNVADVQFKLMGLAGEGKYTPGMGVEYMVANDLPRDLAVQADALFAAASQEANEIQKGKELARGTLEENKSKAALDRLNKDLTNDMKLLGEEWRLRTEHDTKLAKAQGEVAALKTSVAKDSRAWTDISKGMSELKAADDSIAELNKMMKEHPDWVGPVTGRLPMTGRAILKMATGEGGTVDEESRFRAKFVTNWDTVRRMIEAGTRFWNPSEFLNLTPKLAQVSNFADVNIGILSSLRDYVRTTRNAGILRFGTDVNWSRKDRRLLLGTDTDLLNQLWPEGVPQEVDAKPAGIGPVSSHGKKRVISTPYGDVSIEEQ